MTNKDLNTNFRVTLKIENVISLPNDKMAFIHGKIARGSKKLKKAISECFNLALKFIREDIELEHENNEQNELLIS